jgi:lysophospholipase L1-like esterase
MRPLAAAATLLLLSAGIASGPAPDAPPPKLLEDRQTRAVILGDSVAHGAGDERGTGMAGDLVQHLRRLTGRAAVDNFGVNGARTRDTRRTLMTPRVKAAVARADLVVLSIGGNDLYGDRIAQLLSGAVPALQQFRVLRKVENVVGDVLRINPAAKVYVLGLYNPYRLSPRSAWLDEQVNRWDGRLILQFAANRQVTMLRICDLLRDPDRISSRDRFHPGAKGYAAIASRIASSL